MPVESASSGLSATSYGPSALPVVDFKIVMPRSAFAPSPGTEDLPDPAFVQAIKPLGLKFVLKKEPLDLVVVDQLTQPTDN